MTVKGIAMAVALSSSAGALGWAAVSDVRRYEIPNRISVIIVVAFLLAALVMKSAFVIGGLTVAAAIFAVGALLFARGGIGGGDVKLLSAAALWSGPGLLMSMALVISLAGLVLAGLILSPLGRLMPPPPARVAPPPEKANRRLSRPMPYGVAIAAGGLWVLSRYTSYLQ